jgi:hypothetical protein
MTMNRRDVPITTPCGADWTEMTPKGARARLCAACDKVVHDLSAMDEDSVNGLLAAGPACVRYLYDAHGRVLFDVPANARIVPASALLSKAARSKWLALAAVAASAIVFEACGGNNGLNDHQQNDPSSDAGARRQDDAVPSSPARVPADPMPSDDAGPDAEDGDAGAAVDPDGG